MDSSPAIQAVVSKHGGSALQSGHLLYRDIRIAFHGGVDKFRLNLRLILGKLKVNEQCCIDTFSWAVNAIKQETENLKVPLDNSEWSHFIEQAFVKSSIMKELVPTFRGRKMKIADILDIAKVHVQAPDIQEKLNSALGGGAFAASVTGRQNMGGICWHWQKHGSCKWKSCRFEHPTEEKGKGHMKQQSAAIAQMQEEVNANAEKDPAVMGLCEDWQFNSVASRCILD